MMVHITGETIIVRERGRTTSIGLSYLCLYLWFSWRLRNKTREVIDLGSSQATFCPLRETRTLEMAAQSVILTKGLSKSFVYTLGMTWRGEGANPGKRRPARLPYSISKQSRVCSGG